MVIGSVNLWRHSFQPQRETLPPTGGLPRKSYEEVGSFLKRLFGFAEGLAGPLLRVSLGLVLLWIGFIHLVDPQPAVILLSMSLPFLAFSAFVCVLGALEIIAGILLIAGLWVRYVALLSLALFSRTLVGLFHARLTHDTLDSGAADGDFVVAPPVATQTTLWLAGGGSAPRALPEDCWIGCDRAARRPARRARERCQHEPQQQRHGISRHTKTSLGQRIENGGEWSERALDRIGSA